MATALLRPMQTPPRATASARARRRVARCTNRRTCCALHAIGHRSRVASVPRPPWRLSNCGQYRNHRARRRIVR
eukprot:843399-Pyramimonas_sp.AAC.1